MAFSSGMAAETAVILSHLAAGDHLLSANVVYGGTYDLFSTLFPKFGVEVSLVDTTNPKNVSASMHENTKMIFLETPANPTMAVSDIAAIGKIAREAGALLVADNTFATPYFQRPLELGADIVVESCTKYIGGHGDLLAGVAVASQELIKRMKQPSLLAGAVMGTHEAWLCLRGLKTLHLRMERHQENALQLARFLQYHPKVEKVNYPGLASHPQHLVAARQMSGYGGMLSFEVKGGVEAGRKLMNSLELCSLAVSLGSVDTLVEHPASMTHAVMPRAVREQLGITDGLVRVSVGIEGIEDIVADMEQGLDSI